MKERIFFPNLNALRIFAALIVVAHHIEQISSFFSLPNYWSNQVILSMGGLGVTLFFVLSGFLITYLLLVEKQDTKTISIRDFYKRRILRIWPLYLLIIILGLYILPHINYFNIPGFSKEYVEKNLGFKSVLYFLFLSNVALPFFNYLPHISQTWSIGVEEQFYLVWPWIFKKVKANKYLVLFILIALYLLCNVLLYQLPEFTYKGFLIIFWENCFHIDCMAIGALYALVYFNKERSILKFIYNNFVQWSVLIVTLIMIIAGVKLPMLTTEVYAILFGAIILNLATNPNRVINLENKATNFLGKISYGIYMYHPIIIVLTIKLLLLSGLMSRISLYCLAISLTLFISYISYTFFENRFIKLKSKFSKVISGNDAKIIIKKSPKMEQRINLPV